MADFDEQPETKELFMKILQDVQSVILPIKEEARGAPRTKGTKVGGSRTSGSKARTTGGTPQSGGGGGRAGRSGGGDAGGGQARGASGKSHTSDEVAKSPAAAKDAAHETPSSGKKSGESTPSQEHDSNSTNKRKKDAEDKKKSWLDKIGGVGGLVALGITLAMATAIAEKSLESYIKCEDASITITSVKPSPRGFSWMPQWKWLINLFPKPKTVDIQWSADNSYTPLAGSDSWDITGTGTIMDKKGVPIKSVNGKTVTCVCGQDDCSNVKSTTQGTASANCDYSDRLNKAVDDTASDFASTVGKFMTSLGSGLMSFLPIILFVLAAFLLFSMLKS
jgi:hypothetical protein